MVNHSSSLIKLVVVICVLNVAFFITQSDCVPQLIQTLERVIDDSELSKTINDFLEKVPTSHKARSHANRIINEPSFQKIQVVKKTTHTVKNITKTTISYSQKSYSNRIAEILQILLTLEKKSGESCSECTPCPTKKACPKNCKEPCSKKRCPPCLIPDFCRAMTGEQKCPAPPVCPICPATPSLSTATATTSTTTTKRPKVSTTAASPPKTASVKPSTKPATKAPTKPPTKPPIAGSPVSTSTGKPHSSAKPANRSTTSKKPTNGKNSKGVTPPAIILEEVKELLKAEQTTTTNSTSEESTTETTTTTEQLSTGSPKTRRKRAEGGPKQDTSVPTSSSKPMSDEAYVKYWNSQHTAKGPHRGYLRYEYDPTISKWRLMNNKSKKDDGKGNTTKTNTGHNETESTNDFSSQFYGVLLFHNSLERFNLSDSTRDLIRKMVENIPPTNGGQENLIADKILAKFGEQDIKLLKKKGSSREYTIESARTKLMAIFGHILDRLLRKECDCPKCEPIEPCNCNNCAYTMSNCGPCKINDCIYPEGCKKYPPCPKCAQVADEANDDGDLKELDDIDPNNPLMPGELDKPLDCKDGATCPKSANFTCGGAPLNPLTPKTNSSEYMVGGEDIKYGEYPQFVRIEVKVEGKIRSGICGGTLISRTHVITAGHCTQIKEPGSKRNYTKFKPENFKVILGDHKRVEKDKYEEERNVKHITYSSKFNIPEEEGSRYDYAILTLDKPAKFNNYIQPACLPYEPLDFKQSTICHVVGIGITKFDKKAGRHEFAKTIQKMRLKRTSCKSWGFKHDDRSRHCFTKFGAKGDTCGGDSGGPVLCLDHKKRWTLMGMVSYGAEACDGSETTGWVAVYARIKAMLGLIRKDSQSQNPDNFI